jgi:hypothetical protein
VPTSSWAVRCMLWETLKAQRWRSRSRSSEQEAYTKLIHVLRKKAAASSWGPPDPLLSKQSSLLAVVQAEARLRRCAL